MINKILKLISQFIVCTPIYPHYLDFYNKTKDKEKLYMHLYGDVLETGAGNLHNKNRALIMNNKITDYKATDYTAWDHWFTLQTKNAKRFGVFTEILYGKLKKDEQLDIVCSALELPFENESFDSYCCYEVLEHIDDYKTFFKEARRVLKPSGMMVFSMPFLYREHGGIDLDFHRFTRGKFKSIATEFEFEVVELFSCSSFGTTLAILINQYLIRKIMESKNYVLKFILLSIAPLVFVITNTIGFILELFDTDERFASRYNVVMRKR